MLEAQKGAELALDPLRDARPGVSAPDGPGLPCLVLQSGLG